MQENMLHLRMLGPLLLMFSLCDADSMCPVELILDPPEVIGKYNESFLVNCSSLVEDHDGMYWRHGNTDTAVETDKSFVSSSVSLSDWNVAAECRFKMSDLSPECSKDLEITIYNNPEEIIMFPTRYVKTVVEGTLYELQCDILDVAPIQKLTVKWYKDNQTIKTQTFNSTIKTPQAVSSNLTVNISRRDSGAGFRCEAQLDLGPHAPQPPAVSDIHRFSVHYAPEFKNKTLTDVFVNEGDDVTLNCEAEGNPPPVFHWTSGGENISENTSELNITQVNTMATYTCTATNDLGNITKQIHVHVMKVIAAAAAPAAMTTPAASTPRDCPIILTPAEIVVRFGDPASVNCSTSATDAVGMGWEATVGGTGFENTSTVTWTVDKLEDWTIKPQCYVTLEDHQCSKDVAVTLYKTPDSVSVTVLNHVGPMVEGTEYRLKCDIMNVAPVQKLTVKWYRGNKIVRGNKTVQTPLFNDSSSPYNVSSFWSVTPDSNDNREVFRCEAELHLEQKGTKFVLNKTSPPYNATVHYKPRAQPCADHRTEKEHTFSMDMLNCQADGNPPPFFNWYYQGKLINASERLTRNHSGMYTAEVGNYLGRSNISVDIIIEYGPSFSCNDRYEVEEGGTFQTKCEPKGIPLPTITWYKDGKKMATPQRWTKHDSGNYSLEAENEHGRDSHVLSVDVLYAPVFKEENYTKEVTPGSNVTFECRAEGNPPPKIHWNCPSAGNVRNTTEGRQIYISVRGATSTNAGVYICVATNKVGRVARSVKLMMKEKTEDVPPTAWLWILLALLVLGFIILVIFLNSRKKHGQYSFVPDKAKDIPLTTLSSGEKA